MYIEFRLPSGAGGMAAGHAAAFIKQSIVTWAEKYNIRYKTKIVRYTLRLCLESDAEYTLFQLSWTGRKDYVIVHPES